LDDLKARLSFLMAAAPVPDLTTMTNAASGGNGGPGATTAALLASIMEGESGGVARAGDARVDCGFMSRREGSGRVGGAGSAGVQARLERAAADVVSQAAAAAAGLSLLNACQWEVEQGVSAVSAVRSQLVGLRTELAAGRASTAAVLAQARCIVGWMDGWMHG
jgi:hypothetical protein